MQLLVDENGRWYIKREKDDSIFFGGELKGEGERQGSHCYENGCENPSAKKKCPFYLWMGGAVTFRFLSAPQKSE